jgi:purine-nucleoside phosphorylase
MSTLIHRIDETVAAIRSKTSLKPAVGVVLGSGLGAFGDTLDGLVKVPYAELPHLPTSAVVGHAGNFCFGEVSGVPVACMQGRIHLYEGHSVESVVHGVRTMARLGVRAVLLTNAAGGIDASWAPGDLMVISDHLNLTGTTPLLGPNDPELGARFPDMSRAYDPVLREALHEVAKAAKTPAEVRMFRLLGAQAVGMSTVLEVIALRHMGVAVGALSCITNLAAGIGTGLLDHKEVEETARAKRDDLLTLLKGWISAAGKRQPSAVKP